MGKGSQKDAAALSGTKKMRSDFHWLETDEPHASRRKVILAKHPEIKELFGPDPKQAYEALFYVFSQFALVHIMHVYEWSTLSVFVAAYVYGGTVNHALSLATHELSHNLFFESPFHNKLFGIFCNLPMGVPSSVSFKRYHLEHHRFQGHDNIDMDIPTEIEGKVVTNTFTKFIWLCLQPFFYSLRPIFVRPKDPSKWEIINWICVVSFIAFYCNYYGVWAYLYLLGGSLLGMGVHPVAGHFISEHYVFKGDQETYSYYGPLNKVTFNVGYHNEHHDFPRVPGSKLPLVRKMAPEFYDNLHYYNSWPGVLYDYLFNPKIGPFSRVKRAHKAIKDDKYD